MYDTAYNIYTGILKMTSEFSKRNPINISYRFSDDYGVYLEKYHVKEVAGEGADSQKAINLLLWLSGHTSHYGEYMDEAHTTDSVGWLKYAFDQPKHGINCLMLSQILAECLLAVGIKARSVGLQPYSPYDMDCHYVTEAYCGDLNKFIMLDPTYCLYVRDDDGNILNIRDIRKRLADRKKLYFNQEMNYNGQKMEPENIERYYAKNCVYFTVNDFQGRNSQCWNSYEKIIATPDHVDVWLCENVNYQFLKESLGETAWLRERKTFLIEATERCVFTGLDELYE